MRGSVPGSARVLEPQCLASGPREQEAASPTPQSPGGTLRPLVPTLHLCLNRARLFGSLSKLLFLKKRSWALRTISSQFPVSSTPSSHSASDPHACEPLFATLFFPSHEPQEHSVGLKAESRVHECGQPGLVVFPSHEQPLVQQGVTQDPLICASHAHGAVREIT